jgi:tight adherence protein B
LISLLPIAIGLLIFMLNSEYMMQLFTNGIYYMMIPILAAIGVVAGHFVLQRITKIDV